MLVTDLRGPVPTPPSPAYPPKSAHGATLARLAVLLLAMGSAYVITTRWSTWIGAASEQTTDNAYLAADLTPLAAHVAGYVRAVPVVDYQRVRKGDLLVELVDEDYQARRQQAEGGIATTRGRITELEASKRLQLTHIQGAEAQVAATVAVLTRNRLEAERQRTLVASGIAGTRQAVERADADAMQASATFAIHQADLAAAREQLPILDAQIAQQEGTLATNLAQLDLARIDLGHTRIIAPADGEVGSRTVRPGQYVGVGSQVIAFVPLPDVWVSAHYKETQLTRVRAGQRANVAVDAFPRPPVAGAREQHLPWRRLAVLVAAARQRDRQLHQSRSADYRQDRDRRRAGSDGPAPPRHERGRHHPHPGRWSVSDTAAVAGSRGSSLAPALHAAAAPAPLATRPWVGILAVLCGAFIATLTGRLSTFGLADIRGAMHAGFDEGAWITTAQTCAQMLIGPPAVWLGMTFGPRRILVVSALAFAVISALLPLSPNLAVLIGFQALSGLASGTFIPLTLAFVVRNLQPRYWAYGIAAYALNLELSLNIGATLEGFYVEHLSWHWIFWQSVPLAALMAWCVHRGIPKEPVNRLLARTGDWFGMVTFSVGLAMTFAALDQGNRLDWLGSGLIMGLLAGGGLLVAAFLMHERLAPTPWINLSFLVRGPIPLLMLLISLLRFAILSTAVLLPQFFSSVQGYRSLETGPALLALAVPQFVIAPCAGLLLRRVDARLVMATGFAVVGLACWLVSTELTRDWVTADFLPSQAMQAVGQSLAMTAVVFFSMLHLRPSDAMVFGVLLQTARLLGGELGAAAISTFLRVREQVASNLIGLHVQSGALLTTERLQGYAAAVQAQSPGPSGASARAVGLLAQAVRSQAAVQSYIDGFALVALVVAGGLILVTLLSPAPDGPASPVPLRRTRVKGQP